MLKNLQLLIKFLVLVSAALVLYFSAENDYFKREISFLAAYILAISHHLIFEKGSSKLFLAVMSLMACAIITDSTYLNDPGRSKVFLVMSRGSLLIAHGILLVRIIRETRKRFRWTKRSWILGVILLINIYVIFSIGSIASKYGLGFDHILFGFGAAILKLILLSVGLSCCVFDKQSSKKVNLLTWAFACLFLGDVVDITNHLLFFDNLVTAWTILTSGLSVVGLFAFYLYCVGPQDNPLVESTGALEV